MPTGQVEKKCSSATPGRIRREDTDRLIAYECDQATSKLNPPDRVRFDVIKKNGVDVAVNISRISAAAAEEEVNGHVEKKCSPTTPGKIRRDDTDRLIAFECDQDTSNLEPTTPVRFEVSKKHGVDVAVNIRILAAAAPASPAAPSVKKKSAAKKAATREAAGRAAPKAKPAKKAVKRKAVAKATKKKKATKKGT